jgi:putative restriction endonuclease
MATVDTWLDKLSKLRVDRASGDPAPHKPLLLLAVLERAERGQLPPRTLPLTPELAFQFYTYWAVVAHRRRQRPDIRLPFHHLQGDGVWTVLDESGEPSDDSRRSKCSDASRFRELCE